MSKRDPRLKQIEDVMMACGVTRVHAKRDSIEELARTLLANLEATDIEVEDPMDQAAFTRVHDFTHLRIAVRHEIERRDWKAAIWEADQAMKIIEGN